MTQVNRSISCGFLVLIVWLFIAAYTDAQSITWDNTYEQMKISQTKSVLVHGQDSILQTSKVNVGPNYTMDRAIFEIKRNGDQHLTLCYVDLSNCGGYEVNICYCRNTNERNVVSVVLNVTADTLFSKALLQGTIYHFENKIKSKELMLPYILDATRAGIHVYINDRIDQLDFCNKTINQTTAVIVVEKANNEFQYLFSLQDDKTSVYLKNATNFLVHSVEIKEETVLRIAYEIQEIPKIRTSFKCTVRTIPQRTESANHIILILAILLSCAIVFIIICIAIVSIKKRCYRNILIQDKEKSSDECEEVVLLETRVVSDTTTNQNIEKDSREILDLDKSRAITKISSGSKLPSTSNTSISPVMSLPSDVLKLIKDKKGKEDTKAKKAGLLKTSVVGIKALLISNADKKHNLNELMISQFGLMTMVAVESVSNRRPEKWPGTNVPYPYFQKDIYDGESSSRVGVGRIVNVRFMDVNNKQTLLTKHDFESHNGKKITKWAEIDIYTSRHVVFDDQEAKDATVSLMLDSPDIPGVRLKGKRVRMSNIGENWILLTCVSYDIDPCNILHQRLQMFKQEWSRNNEKYELFSTQKNAGYFLLVSEGTIKKVKFIKLLDFFMKDRFLKPNIYALNTYFKDENVAIFVERTSESLICTLSEDKGKKLEIEFDRDEWILGSLPLVIKSLNTV